MATKKAPAKKKQEEEVVVPPPKTDPYSALWVEKYRPTLLEEVALSEDHRKLLTGYLEDGEIPHLLLHGPAGTGKTTVAKILIGSLDCTAMALNASSERGIDTIRDKVGRFSRTKTPQRWNIVFLDEGDKLTPDAQTALRNDMESYAQRTRFIFTANFLSKILDPIQSRCTLIELSMIPLKERFQVIKRIMDAEEVEHDPAVLFNLAEKYTDMRRLLMTAQHLVRTHGSLTQMPPEITGSVEEVWDAIARKDWTSLVQVSKRPGVDHALLLRELFWKVEGDTTFAFLSRAMLAKAVHDSGYTPDPVVLFLGTCATMMAGEPLG